MHIKLFFSIALILFLARNSHAQDEIEHLSPFAHGAGRTYALSSRGLDAVGLNPSLLAFGTARPIEITLFPISSFGIDKGPSLSQINGISQGFQGNGLSSTQISNTPDSISQGDSTRESLANLLGGNNLSSSIDLRVFGLSYYNPDFGGLALTWTMHSALEASIPDALLSYIGVGAAGRLAQGYQLSPQTITLQALWYSEYTLSYGRMLIGTQGSSQLQLLGGVGVKYITGIAAFNLNQGIFSINEPEPQGGHYVVSVDYQMQSAYPKEFNFNNLPTTFSFNLIKNASAGSGYGGDIGFTLGAFDSLQRSPWEFALSVSDIGSIRWNSNVTVRSADTVLSPLTSQSNKDTINNQLKALGGRLDTTAGSFTTQLPTTIHIAGALDLSQIGLSMSNGSITAAAEYALGLVNVAGAPTHGRFGIAAILDEPGSAFSYRTSLGFTTQDGISDLTFGFGVGFGNTILLDAGTDGVTQLFKQNGHSDFVFGLKVLL